MEVRLSVHSARLPRTGRAMLLRLLPVLALIGLAASLRADERPSRAEQDAFLAVTRRAVLDYDRSLPDFLCTLTIQRYKTTVTVNSAGIQSTLEDVLSDTVVASLTYYQRSEQYTVLTVNGSKPVQQDYLDGLASSGEYGMVLRNIFEGPAKLDFKKWTSIHSRKAALYSFRVGASARPYQLMAWDSRRKALRTATVALSGELCIDAETHLVWRLSYESEDVPRFFPISEMSTSVEYNYAAIAEREYLLPAKAIVRVSAGFGTRNELSFGSYRKFSSDATIRFEKEPAEGEVSPRVP